MKAACIILSVLIFIAMMAVCVMVKFATDITVEEKKRESMHASGIYRLSQSMGVVHLDGVNSSYVDRFPYVAAITRNHSKTYYFSCFASIILIKWVVAAAHCRHHGATHRVLIYYDFGRNYTYTYPILFWRIHEKFNITNRTPKFDIAVAKLNTDYYPLVMKSSLVDEHEALEVEASVWKTLTTMDQRAYLTDNFDKFNIKIVDKQRCYESYGLELDDSLICVDLSDYEDCFLQEFGPIYERDKIVGLLAVKPRDCETKLAIFTNVSYYTNWILKSTQSNLYG